MFPLISKSQKLNKDLWINFSRINCKAEFRQKQKLCKIIYSLEMLTLEKTNKQKKKKHFEFLISADKIVLGISSDIRQRKEAVLCSLKRQIKVEHNKMHLEY